MHHSFLSSTEEFLDGLLLGVETGRANSTSLSLDSLQVSRHVKGHSVDFQRRQSRQLGECDTVWRHLSDVPYLVAVPPRLHISRLRRLSLTFVIPLYVQFFSMPSGRRTSKAPMSS